ncbi:hypothetical protein HZH66_013145 [Vespula vulgaris]|uniref:Uncharacterized protein n=1 Tax=Vespula vulgaris TaxID=7454 RepID=A0A834MTU4_VESVU|nr:hypothetical protein HZH66_013145 [Vespula vulgaris]
MNVKRRQQPPKGIPRGKLPIMGKYSSLRIRLFTYKNSAVYDQQRIHAIKVFRESLYKTPSIFANLVDTSYVRTFFFKYKTKRNDLLEFVLSLIHQLHDLLGIRNSMNLDPERMIFLVTQFGWMLRF